MYRILRQVRIAIITMTLVIVGDAVAFESDLDWCWSDHSKPASLACTEFVVSDNPQVIKRGYISANKCLRNAIDLAKKDEKGLASGWLAACQCHNLDAKRKIESAGYEAVDYVVETYGGGY